MNQLTPCPKSLARPTYADEAAFGIRTTERRLRVDLGSKVGGIRDFLKFGNWSSADRQLRSAGRGCCSWRTCFPVVHGVQLRGRILWVKAFWAYVRLYRGQLRSMRSRGYQQEGSLANTRLIHCPAIICCTYMEESSNCSTETCTGYCVLGFACCFASQPGLAGRSWRSSGQPAVDLQRKVTWERGSWASISGRQHSLPAAESAANACSGGSAATCCTLACMGRHPPWLYHHRRR